MLYSIIPPILVILSLIGIILFLMKKAPQIAQLDEENPKSGKGESLKISLEKTNNRFKKTTQKFNRIFKWLKNFLFVWKKFARRKKQTKLKKDKARVLENISEEELFIQEVEIDNVKKSNQHPKNTEKKLEDFFGKNKKVIRPTISKKVVKPQKIKENQFEKMLINKIAANPKNIKAYKQLGEYYMEIKNWNYAKECFKQIIKLSPGNINAKIKIRKLERLLSK